MKNNWSRRELEALGEPNPPGGPTRLSQRVGGGGKGSTPEPPDYVGAAEATAKSNAEAIKAQTIANRPNIVTPFGTQSWTNERSFDQAGYDAAMADYNAKRSQASSPTQRWVDGGSSGGDNGFSGGGYWETVPGEGMDIAMPDRNAFYGEDNWTQTTTLTPEAQKALDSQMKIQQGRSDTALGLMPEVNKAITNPIDKSQLQNWGAAPTLSNFQTVGTAPDLLRNLNLSGVPGMPSASNFQDIGNAPQLNTGLDKSGVVAAPNVSNFQNVGNAPTLATAYNKSGIPGMPGDSNDAFVQKYVDKANEFARPQNERNQSNLDAKLYNMGLTPGSKAWVNAQRELADQISRNEFNAINTGMNQSNQMYVNQLAANNQGFNQAAREGEFSNTALQNQNSMNLGNAGFNNANLEKQFSQQLGLNNQTFNQALQEGNFGNTAMQNQNQMNLANLGFNNANKANQFTQQMGMNNQGFNQALAGGQFTNSALQNQNQMNLANAGFNNNAANTNFNQQMAQSNYADQLRQAQWTMAQQEQLQPLNNLNALLNGQQVAMPNMPSFNTAGNAGGVNYSGAVNNQYQADLAQANAANAADAGLISGLFNMGGMALGGPMGGGLASAFGFGAKMMSNNNFQQFQGYGVPQYDPNQWDVAAQVAALPDTGLTNKFINTAMPEGQMISGHYVAPSWSQNLAAGLKQGMGGQMYSEGTKARNAMVKLLRDRSKNLGADSMSGLTGEGGVGVTEDQRY